MAVALGSALLLGVGACGSPETCTSPRAESPRYPGDTTPGVTDADQSTWRLGVIAEINPPEDDEYIGVVAGFRNPDFADAEWHDSGVIPKGDGFDEKLRFAIGNGPVQLSVEIVAAHGSELCTSTPTAVTFSPQAKLLSEIDQAGGITHPAWPE